MTRTLLLSLFLPASASAADRVQEEVAGMMGVFYDLRLAEARLAAEGLERRHPGHPAGAFFRGIEHYLSLLVEDPVSTGTVKEFLADMDRSISAAEKNRDIAPALAEYYLGAAHGFKARVASMRGNWFDAVKGAREAIGHVKKAVELDPSLEDTYLGLGMYHYFLARMPAPAKPFAYLLAGLWGDAEKGLAELERAAERSPIASSEALGVLSYIYGMREGKPEKADALLARLVERHPRNPGYRIWRANLAARQGRWKEADAFLDLDGAWWAGVSPEALRTGRPYAAYLSAECLLMAKDAEGAQRRLALLDPATAPGPLKDWILLRRANLLDLKGRRGEALALYRQAGGKAGEAAKAFLKSPFAGGGPRLRFFWPRTALPKED
ncbi:MAG TPA: hypothetical protein DCM05_02115 [Elusimicrobia bacterium]|nr:hypothetical protein [Elusimicrobiota bacterium]